MKTTKIQRASGVLLNISSLPSEFGIGCFSHDAETFSDLIADMGFSWWQVLPITTIGWGNSPYSGLSTYAGNSLYINPYVLLNQGLLTENELREAKFFGEPYLADYDFARNNSSKFLHLAFARINNEYQKQIDNFYEQEKYWLRDYALFMALSESRGSIWRNWEAPLKFRDKKALENAEIEYKHSIAYYIFEQFEFFKQWKQLKSQVNKRGIRIIGDLPFYVSTDSVDVWANPQNFQLDENLNPVAVAGVPPDSFASDGQIWGNCLYNFKAMENDGFSWWRKRILHCEKLYDALRLDHFRAFYNYFSIPACDTHTAVNGHWEEGAKDKLLDLIKSDAPDYLFIAEDLGLIDDGCREYIDNCEFPTMRVFQFGFDYHDSPHIPYRYTPDTVAYSGTHDNNTLLGWLYELNDGTREYALKYCGFSGAGWGAGGPQCESTKAILKTLIASASSLVVFPLQDMLGYGTDTRMNVPGVAEGNWKYRLPYELLHTVDRDYFLEINRIYGRK